MFKLWIGILKSKGRVTREKKNFKHEKIEITEQTDAVECGNYKTKKRTEVK